MLDAIKHITDDNFFFQEDSALVHCVCVCVCVCACVRVCVRVTIQLSENVIFAFPRFVR